MRRAVEARRLERELDATVAEQLESVMAQRGPGAVAKQLPDAVASACRDVHGCMKVEAVELRLMTKRLVVVTGRGELDPPAAGARPVQGPSAVWPTTELA